MGILDEAIREHLDLKRRHGAAEAEVKQLEDEAFGPPARPGEPDFPERAADGEGEPEGVVEPPAPVEAPAEPPGAESVEATAAEPDAAEAETAFHGGGGEGALDLSDLDLGTEEGGAPPAAGAQEAEVAPAPGEPPIESLETVEHDIEEPPSEEHPLEEPPSEEQALADDEAPQPDVLEETPEFLRDHPDDDELWFEQGEPKDFDF